MNNAMKIKDANYSFKIISENEKDLFPISGELYIKKEKYFIDTEEIDQIFDGDKLLINRKEGFIGVLIFFCYIGVLYFYPGWLCPIS